MERPRILLADDSVTIRKVVELTFADEGIDVECVGDGDAAMVSFVANEPNLVIADVNMPGVSGYTICEMIKQDESTRDIPVILLTGSFEPFDAGEASRVGANYYFTKPFQSIRELVAKVRDLLDTKAFDATILAETEDIDGLYKDSFADTLKIEGHSTVPEIGYEGMEAEISAHQAAAIEHEEKFPENLTVADLGYEGMDDDITERRPEAKHEKEYPANLSVADLGYEGMDDEIPEHQPDAKHEKEFPANLSVADLGYEGMDDEIPEHQPDAKHEKEYPADLTVADLGYEGMDDEMSQPVVRGQADSKAKQVAPADENDPFSAPIDLGDASLDDEMIETSRPSEAAEIADDVMAIHVADTLRFEPSQTSSEEVKIDPFETPITTDDTIAKFNWTDEAAELVDEPAIEANSSETSTLLKIEFADNDDESKEILVNELAEANETRVDRVSPATADAYPPELIELVARRVIEYLSDKVIRDVAMEVVPKITEDMIREALENESIK